ncbi:SLC13 family permease [Comamonas kerstersii]|uniref:Transporter n=1 Tax=Comamonas kerstersii TaxID=225992 RepID=A0A6A1R219_9BURK|nr:SLC13 family permease [Comamonas kerstersii]KAB0586383.1 transporter [Comamonas kerstersii]
MNVTLLIFILVYIAMGFGKLPGFKIDRTGAAVVGALAMMALGSISAQAAWQAMDYKTLGLLFGLMVISGAFAVSGFYAWTAQKVALLPISPAKLLAVFVLVSGVLSSMLTNDVVVVAMTPLLVSITLTRGLNPIPFLLAFCFAANAGSVGTMIGSPQNMIAAQALDVSFVELLKLAGVPALGSLVIVWGVVAWLYRGRWTLPQQAASASAAAQATPVVLNVTETLKAALVMAVTVVLFVLDIWPQEIVALGAAGILLVNRSIASSDVLQEVDGNLLLLIMGLFVVNAAMAVTGLPQQVLGDLKHMGVNLDAPQSLFWTSAVLSNIVGNNPAVMLLVPYLQAGANSDALCAALALGTGFSSNMVIFGSLAGIVVVEQAKASGVNISFMDFAKAGLPVALICLLLSALWIAWL